MDPTIPAGEAVPELLSALPDGQPTAPSLLVGLQAAKANLVPGLCLQGLMLAVVVAYYRFQWARPWFDRLGALKQRTGYFYTMISAVIAGALLPAGFKLGFLERRWPRWGDASEVLFAAGFYAVNALCVDVFYRGQTVWFGADATLPVIVRKVAVDQFIYNPVFSAPFAVVCFAWKNHRYRFRDVVGLLKPGNYVLRVVPTLIATWLVWIPVVAVLYSLPPLLQIPVYGLALCFWALMLAYIHAKPVRAV